jgi:glutamyl/glutaminyl-tRNA synthetase
LKNAGLWSDEIDTAYFHRVLDLMRERIKIYSDIPSMAGYFFIEDYPYDEKAVAKRLKKEGAIDGLRALRERFAGLENFDAPTLEVALRNLAEERGAQAGDLVHPIRVAVSGTSAGPSLFQMLDVMGRERVLTRIDRTLERYS